MSDQTRTERAEALDQFAKGTEEVTELVPIAQASGPAPQVWGAQNVAVRRDERLVLQKIRTLAAAASTEWFYRFPVKNKRENRVDHIEGPSVKLANDLARLYGNCDIDCRATDLGTHILFTARFIDLETGYSLTRPFQQRKGASRMGADQDRQADITFQIGASKAIRNVIVNALQTFADFALSEAKEALVERIGSDLPKWRERTLTRLREYPVDLARVEAVIGRPAREWVATDLARVIASMKAVADGMATIDETFPPRKEEASELDQFVEADRAKAGSGGAAEPTAPGAPTPPGLQGRPLPQIFVLRWQRRSLSWRPSKGARRSTGWRHSSFTKGCCAGASPTTRSGATPRSGPPRMSSRTAPIPKRRSPTSRGW
jgi:hypothetical protein